MLALHALWKGHPYRFETSEVMPLHSFNTRFFTFFSPGTTHEARGSLTS